MGTEGVAYPSVADLSVADLSVADLSVAVDPVVDPVVDITFHLIFTHQIIGMKPVLGGPVAVVVVDGAGWAFQEIIEDMQRIQNMQRN